MKNFFRNSSSAPFLVDAKSGEVSTYADFAIQFKKVATYFQNEGIGAGDTVGVFIENSTLLAQIYFACLHLGVAVVPLHPGWSKHTFSYVLEKSQPVRIVTTGAELPCQTEIPELQIDSDRYVNLIPLDTSFCHPDNIAIIIFTSGTTKDPKGVIHTVSNLVNNGAQFVQIMGLRESSRFYNNLSMAYLGGYYNLLLIPYLAGGSVVIDAPFSAMSLLRFWDPIIRHSVNTIWFVPSMVVGLLKTDRDPRGREYAAKNVDMALIGTAPLPTHVKSSFESEYGVILHENYGLSETLFISTQRPGSRSKSVGHVLDGVTCHLMTKDGVIDDSKEGEIVVKTPSLLRGYLHTKPGEHLSSEGYFLTGDVGIFTDEGELQISGREKDLIIRSGLNISPAVIEDVVLRHPEVSECAAVGIPNDVSGEEIVVVYKSVPHSDTVQIEADLALLCQEFLSRPECPSRFLPLSEIPYTHNGKVQKRKIRAWVVDLDQASASIKPKSESPSHSGFFKGSQVVTAIEDALSIRYNTMVYEQQRRGEKVTVLSLGEAFFDIPLFDFSVFPTDKLYHYSHSRGIFELREKLSHYFRTHYEVTIDPEHEILVTAGSKIAIYMIFLTLLNPGDEVLVPDPSWVSYPEQIKLCHGVPVTIPYDVPVSGFEKYITNRTKVIVINNPNNPRGHVYSLSELAELYSLAEKYNLYILSDEAYSDFVQNEQFVSMGNLDVRKERSVIVNSISKNFGISGWRIGYVISNKTFINHILKLNQHLITCAPTILLYYVFHYFDQILDYTKPQIKTLHEKRNQVLAVIDELGMSYLSGSSTFYIFLSIAESKLSSDDFCMRLLSEFRVCVVPGIGYGQSCDKYVRVSVGTETLENTIEGLKKIKTLIELTSQ